MAHGSRIWSTLGSQHEEACNESDKQSQGRTTPNPSTQKKKKGLDQSSVSEMSRYGL